MNQLSNKQCEICKIFSNANRIDILVALRDNPKTVSEIVKQTNMPQSVVSQHLAILRNKNIVESEKKGAWIIYKLSYPEIMDAFDIMSGVTKKITGSRK
ncbi:winged helix-turn-helix transcriptional regulator [Candidatus Woesearchaeota archaeon]|nr:winged helix-turn-helix transcriptional regulator [Candidatus Woesearchaeota archaeon]